jgi:lysozyme
MMQPSPAVEALCREFEGERLVAYRGRDGVWTNGVGHTAGVYPGQVITSAISDRWLCEDIAVAGAGVNHALGVASLTQGEFDAITAWVFNFGISKLMHGGEAGSPTHLYLALVARNFSAAAAEFPKWVHVGAVVEPGLVRRRAVEQAMFLGLPRPQWTFAAESAKSINQ